MNLSVRITGESGQGINSMGEILSKALKDSGYYTFGYREYPSLIKGGVAMYQLEISDKPISSVNSSADVQFSLSRSSLHHYSMSMKAESYIFYTFSKNIWPAQMDEYIKTYSLHTFELNATEATLLSGGSKLMTNVYILGYLWNLLGIEIEQLVKVVREKYAKKPELLDINEKILIEGYNCGKPIGQYSLSRSTGNISESYILTGNDAIALGAISAGCRAFYGYPMTPATTILTTLSGFYKESGMLVKQVDDEITAAQMMLGSMFMGTRAMTATSGGGFDLMTESLSFSGMAEIPALFVLAQRPGPATGLPTWTSASDLDLAIYSGHGEFPRVVIALSDPTDSYTLIAEAFNIAEKYQVPVILLTDKHLAESLYLTPELLSNASIERGITAGDSVNDSHSRYAFTTSGVSPRWLPGESEQLYVTNSDEHSVDGSSTEDMGVARAMYDKRLEKLNTIGDSLPEPILEFYDESTQYLIVSYGSPVPTLRDSISHLRAKCVTRFALLKYEYLFPLRTELLESLLAKNLKIILVEQNATGQFERLLTEKSGIRVNTRFRKYDGKPIFRDEITNFLLKLR